MATVNNRVKIIQAAVINGVDAGGAMSAQLTAGYDNVMRSSPDGIGGPPIQDKEIQFVRGTLVTQDWVHLIDLLTGTLGSHTFYERKSGVAEATGYIKHTIVNPVIHRASLSINQKGYAVITAQFECRAADETVGFSDMWTQEDSQAKPTYISAARGGYRVETTVFTPDAGGTINIYHVTAFEFMIALLLQTACNDADVGYTCVDAEADVMTAGGSISFQGSAIATSLITAQRFVAAGRGTLVLTVTQSGGATDKVVTLAGVDPENFSRNSAQDFAGHTVNYNVGNSAGTPLTLSGTNKIITIADAV